MSVYDIGGNTLSAIYDINGVSLNSAYNYNNALVFSAGEVIPTPPTETFSVGYINDNGELINPVGSHNYVSDNYRSANEKITIITAESEIGNVNTLRIAEYDGNKQFIQRQYIQHYHLYEFTLSANTEYIRVGFQVSASANLNDLFTYYQATNNPIICCQIGYDIGKSKRATIIGKNSLDFYIANEDNEVVYTGTVINEIADFTDFEQNGKYYIYCDGIRSWTFTIAENRIWDVTALPSLKFMEMSRQDVWDVGGNTGYAWRDSHQFSFELNGLVMQYMSNPSYYNSLPWDVYNVSQTEYANLRTQDCPNIIWLMKFAIERYYDWNINDGIDLHALIKGQIAYFLYIYPHISQYVDSTWYATIRDWAINIWSVETCNKSWYEVSGGINHNLFTTQNKIGTVKGMLPPAYAIVPNLMMYEVATRDSLSSASDFMTSAQNNMNWLVNSVDLTDPANTKGQRMSEYIPFHALTYMYELYPTYCPSGTYNKIVEIANVLISRSNNMWDYTQYQTAGDLSGATTTIWNNNASQTSGLANNPAYISMMGVYYALARVITDTSIKSRLKELAMSHMSHGFGRNPLSRCYCYKAVNDFVGAKYGWVKQQNGAGDLNWVTGVLDGSPKEDSFPYNPSASTGYTEGWVAFNTAWNMALAYLNGENASITNGIGIFA